MRSTLITRAPRSARLRVASGAATACSIATTVMPSSGRLMTHFLCACAHQSAADDQALDLAGALVQAHQPDVAVDPLDGHLPHVAGAAVDLHRQVGDLAGHLGAEQLGRRRRDAPVLAGRRTAARPRAPAPARPSPRSAGRRSSPGRVGSRRSGCRPGSRSPRRRPTRRGRAARCPTASAAMWMRPRASEVIAAR